LITASPLAIFDAVSNQRSVSFRNTLKKIPGFRSGTLWKSLVAGVLYSFTLLTLLVILVPTSPTLALEEIPPSNKSSISLKGKTRSGRQVHLLQNGEAIQSVKADSAGRFFFALNDLKDGHFTYTVQVCDSDEKSRCTNKNILIIVDQTPPDTPLVSFPEILPEDGDEEITISGFAEPGAKIVASVGGRELPEFYADERGTFETRTGLVLGINTVSLKAVDPVGNESDPTVHNIEFYPKRCKAKVVRVIDGDTVEIEGGQRVRYIGIDTPETKHPSKPVECYGQEAYDKNRELVEGKEVKLEKDVSETDKYGRLLRYIWLGDTLVNEVLVREGYAQSSSYPPDVKYQERFVAAERAARGEGAGLWGSYCTNWGRPAPVAGAQTDGQEVTSPTPTTPPPESELEPEETGTNSGSDQGDSGKSGSGSGEGSYTCDCSKTCPQMSSCEEAYFQLNNCGCSERDGNNNGVPCEKICHR